MKKFIQEIRKCFSMQIPQPTHRKLLLLEGVFLLLYGWWPMERFFIWLLLLCIPVYLFVGINSYYRIQNLPEEFPDQRSKVRFVVMNLLVWTLALALVLGFMALWFRRVLSTLAG